MSYECILPFFVFHVVVYMMHVQRGSCCRDHMVVGFSTTYVISTYYY